MHLEQKLCTVKSIWRHMDINWRAYFMFYAWEPKIQCLTAKIKSVLVPELKVTSDGYEMTSFQTSSPSPKSVIAALTRFSLFLPLPGFLLSCSLPYIFFLVVFVFHTQCVALKVRVTGRGQEVPCSWIVISD